MNISAAYPCFSFNFELLKIHTKCIHKIQNIFYVTLLQNQRCCQLDYKCYRNSFILQYSEYVTPENVNNALFALN